MVHVETTTCTVMPENKDNLGAESSIELEVNPDFFLIYSIIDNDQGIFVICG